jgi:transposase
MSRNYPSDISLEQFKKICPILESARKKTCPRKINLYDIFCGVLYVLKSACQWRMLPTDFPKKDICYYYFRIWSEKKDENHDSILERILKEMVSEVRKNDDREEKTSFIIIDAQSVKNTDTAKNKGYDAGKKVSGIKRHIAVDTNGLPHALFVTTANISDREGALQMFSCSGEKLSAVKNSLYDGGYTGKKFADSVKDILGCDVEIAKRNELHKVAVIPKRWVVERSFSWLEKCRRLWKNCERKLNSSLQMMVLAFAVLLLKRL